MMLGSDAHPDLLLLFRSPYQKSRCSKMSSKPVTDLLNSAYCEQDVDGYVALWMDDASGAPNCRCARNFWRLGFGVAGHRTNNIHIHNHNHILKTPHPNYVIATMDGC